MIITEEHAKPPPIAVPSQVNHFSKFIYFQHVTQEEQGLAQPPLWRSDALAGRHPDDQGDRRHRHPARYLRARPHHRRQTRACEFEGVEADLTAARPTRFSILLKNIENNPMQSSPWCRALENAYVIARCCRFDVGQPHARNVRSEGWHVGVGRMPSPMGDPARISGGKLQCVLR